MSDHVTEVVHGATENHHLAGVAVVQCTCGWRRMVEYTDARAQSMAERIAAARGREHEGQAVHA